MSVTRPEASLFAGGWVAPASGFGPAAFPPAAPPSSSGRGRRLSNEAPIGFALVPAGDRNSGGATADLEPCSETPRMLAPLPEDKGGTLAPGPAGEPGDTEMPVGNAGGGEVGGDEMGGDEMGVGGVPRESGGLDVNLGDEMGCDGGTAVVPADGAAVPDGCQPDGDDGGDDGDE